MKATAFLGIIGIVVTFLACISWGTRYQPLTLETPHEEE
jgi:hypothetical protein